MYMKKITKYILFLTAILMSGFLGSQVNAQEVSETEITFGSEYVFNMASTSDISLDDLSSSKAIVVYKDGGGNFNQGTAIIANVSGSAITYGSEYVFNPAVTDYALVKMISENKAIIAYKDDGNSNYGTAIIANISGDTITFGSEYVFNTALTENTSIAMLSENKFVIAYQDSKDGHNQGKTIVGNIDGDVITYGLEYVFNTASIDYLSMVTLSENKFAIVYQDISNGNQGSSIIGLVSGSSINFGSEYVFNTADTRDVSAVALSDSKIVVGYKDKGGNNYGRALIGDVDNDVITYGLEYVFNPAITNYVSVTNFSENKVAISYQDYGNNQYGTAVVANISNNIITYGSEYVFNTANTGVTFSKIISQSKFFVTYQDGGGNLNYGTAIIGSIPAEEIVEPEPEPEPIVEPQPTPEDSAGEAEPDVIIDETIKDGDLIRNPSAEGIASLDIYIVKLVGDKKFKRLILSPHVFESYEHLNWEDVKDVNQATMDVYSVSSLIRAVGDLKVYELFPSGDVGTKKWLNITAEEFVNQGYDSDSIYEINSTDIGSYAIILSS